MLAVRGAGPVLPPSSATLPLSTAALHFNLYFDAQPLTSDCPPPPPARITHPMQPEAAAPVHRAYADLCLGGEQPAPVGLGR